MRELVVISGKGGTGKTSITASFAALSRGSVFADCDVDAADLHLLLAPEIREREVFRSGFKPVIESDLCTECGRCRELCRFDAIDERFQIDHFDCEGCGVCADHCPAGAIRMEENECGEVFVSKTRFGTMVHARLGIAEENTGRLVTRVRKLAREHAEAEGASLIIADGSPGIGCPVIASITGARLALIVSEPTVSGLHDTSRVLGLLRHFNVPAAVVINKCDLNAAMSREIRFLCSVSSVPCLGEIPFDHSFTEALVNRKTLIEYCDGGTSGAIGGIWESAREMMGEN
ncbi:MAG: ATP-binding protein [Candidatus Eremiobacteraeota bacterium]|nr:ATP-binding protein [Candidatus Eremiobacteraeota bacterium]